VLDQLPERIDKNLFVPMTAADERHHDGRMRHRRADRAALAQALSSDEGSAAADLALQNMRMSCNSTYLLDQETDHGVKADEADGHAAGRACSSSRTRRWWSSASGCACTS
jgi:hypothetical protein